MTLHITITNGLWLKAGEEAIMQRIAQIIHGVDRQVERKLSGYAWTLDVSGNNWWASELQLQEIDGRPVGTLELAYRYGGGGNAEFFTALGVVLNWLFQ